MFADPSSIPVPAYKPKEDHESAETFSLDADLSSMSVERPPSELQIDSEGQRVQEIDASVHQRPCFRLKWLTRCRNCFYRRKSSSVRSTHVTSSSSSSSSAAQMGGCSCSGPFRRAAAPPPSSSTLASEQTEVSTFSSDVCTPLEPSTDQPPVSRSEGVSFSLPLEKGNRFCPAAASAAVAVSSGLCSANSMSRQCSPLRSILKRSSSRATAVDGRMTPAHPAPPAPAPPAASPPPPPPSAEASNENGRISVASNNPKKFKVGKTSKPLRTTHSLDPWALGFPITWSFICNPDFSIIDMHLS